LTLLERGNALREAGKKPVERMKSSVEQMKQMIQDLLDTHKLEAGRLDLAEGRSSHSVLSIVQPALERQDILVRQKNLNLEMEIPDDLPTLFVNVDRVQQVFQNLIGNAIKFTGAGGK